MVAYLHKEPGVRGYELRFFDRVPFGEDIHCYRKLVMVSGKREARKVCMACGAKPWNF